MTDENNTSISLSLPANIPTFHASFAFIGIAANDFNILLARPRPKLTGNGVGLSPDAEMQPVALLYINPRCAKDLRDLLTKAVEGYEQRFGSIPEDATDE